MMVIKTVRLLHLISYLLVTSQVLFYLFILSDALKEISIPGFYEQRKVIDSLMIGRFKLMYYGCLTLSIVIILLSFRHYTSLFFISSVLALGFLIVDLVVTVKLSMPLNALAHTYHEDVGNVDWNAIRIEWLDYMRYRGMAITAGMVGLLSGLVFEKTGIPGS